MDDKLTKLGYRLRKVSRGETPGAVEFDDRNNAVYQWKHKALEHDSAEGERLREQALEHPGLAIVDDEPPPEAMIQANPKGMRLGYDPYASGMLEKKGHKRKTDLRELSRWIEMKRKADQKKGNSGE